MSKGTDKSLTRAPWRPSGANYVVPQLRPEEHQANIDRIRKQLDDRYGPEKSGSALAEGIRLDAEEVDEGRGPWGGVTQTCVDCERQTIEHLEDSRCSQCNGTVDEEAEGRKRALARRELFATTAKYLRKAGYPGRAVWYEERLRETE